MRRKEYRSEQIVVPFDLERCIHANYCVRGLPEVFDPSNRPWGCVPAALKLSTSPRS
jgi:uncharacterized Fe-S cluster protein YjdI